MTVYIVCVVCIQYLCRVLVGVLPRRLQRARKKGQPLLRQTAGTVYRYILL